jgi:hypothetical protein
VTWACYVISHYMARGESGRIVLEIEPFEKEELYAAVTKDGMTLKEWFRQKASEYLRERNQLQLFGAQVLAEAPVTYRATRKKGAKSKTQKSKK